MECSSLNVSHYIDDQQEHTFSLQLNFIIKPYVGVVVERIGLFFWNNFDIFFNLLSRRLLL